MEKYCPYGCRSKCHKVTQSLIENMATQMPTVHHSNIAKAVHATTCCATYRPFREAETLVCRTSRVWVRILMQDYKLTGEHKAVNALTKTNALCYSCENRAFSGTREQQPAGGKVTTSSGTEGRETLNEVQQLLW